ncbi:uncharacterized protein EAF02_006714 [Botrytis sinoallii]|uniref:uncharacterized protein n=1 Tax=Botrytis sinoallii TaxID=1463999 RepID=UPI001900C0BD|nr:uncharacterized protein EAF02_006714 [Botrytis sinoallii]KAF7880823.1 hypothetical protein EAF02_006714 [Botrytis sinoallii]
MQFKSITATLRCELAAQKTESEVNRSIIDGLRQTIREKNASIESLREVIKLQEQASINRNDPIVSNNIDDSDGSDDSDNSSDSEDSYDSDENEDSDISDDSESTDLKDSEHEIEIKNEAGRHTLREIIKNMKVKLNDFKRQKEEMSALSMIGLLIRHRLITSSLPGSVQNPSIPKKRFKEHGNFAAHGPNPVADAFAVLHPSLLEYRESFSEHYKDIYGIEPSVIIAKSSFYSFVRLVNIHGSFRLYLPLDLKSARNLNHEQLQCRVALLIFKVHPQKKLKNDVEWAADAKVCKELEELNEIKCQLYADKRKLNRHHR